MTDQNQKPQVPARIAQAQTLRTYLSQEPIKKQLIAALPKHISVDRLLRLAMTTVQTTPDLLDCTRESILASLIKSAQLGLELVIGQAYLVPFRNKTKGVKEAQFIPGYRGLVDLARRSGVVRNIKADVVYQKDLFLIKKGLENTLIHEPYVPSEEDEKAYLEALAANPKVEPPDPRGRIVGVYAVTWYKDGEPSFDFMPRMDVDRIRRRSASPDSGPWVTDYIEMAKKTVIRRHVKTEPMSIEFAQAVALEEAHLAGDSQAGINFLGDGDDDVKTLDIDQERQAKIEAFRSAVPAEIDPEALETYLGVCSEYFKTSVDDVKLGALEKMPEFLEAFKKWKDGQDKKRAALAKDAELKAKEAAGKKAEKKGAGKVTVDPGVTQEGQADLASVVGDNAARYAPAPCPNEPGVTKLRDFCVDECKSRPGCPAWE